MSRYGLSEAFSNTAFHALRERGLRDLIDQSEIAVVCCQPGPTISYTNSAFKELFRSQRSEIVEGASMRAILTHALDCGEIMAGSTDLAAWFDDLDTGRAEGVFRFRSGRWMLAIANQVAPDGLVVILTDVSSFKKREAWLTELHDRLAGEGEDLKHFARHLALARAEVTVALNQAEQANAALQKEIAERRNLERELRKLANTDELTGVLNRRRFMELTQQENIRARRQQDPLCILMMDLDHFKSINDLYGHEAGDEVLRQFSKIANSLLRDGDLFARLGGEEFAALLPETGQEEALAQAERLRSATELLQVYHAGEAIAVTVSIGVASIDQDDKTPLAFIGRADRALYQAKREGRNRVSLYTSATNAADALPAAANAQN